MTDVLETGGNDVYLIKGSGGERLVPALPQFVSEIDLEAGRDDRGGYGAALSRDAALIRYNKAPERRWFRESSGS